jgi:hypothetical protein
MNLSEQLLAQAERFKKTKSFHLSNPLKKELANWHETNGHGKLKTCCNSYIRNAMGRLVNSLNKEEQLTPRIHFIGIKQ